MSVFEQLSPTAPIFEPVRDFMELGGDVLWLIAGLTLFMWLLIFERVIYLYGRHGRVVATVLARWEGRGERRSWFAHRQREWLISLVGQGLERNLTLIKSCVAMCPLFGLLGTVTGMIEVFEVMAIYGSGNPRSMAAGVSKATVPTMAGMVAALSGVAIYAWLQRRAQREKALVAEHMTMDH